LVFGIWRGFDPLIVSLSVCLCSSIECKGLKTWIGFDLLIVSLSVCLCSSIECEGLEIWIGFDPLIMSLSVCLCSSIEFEGLKTWMAWMVVVGVFIAPTTIPAVAVDGHTRQSGGASDMSLFIVQCMPRQPTVGVWSCWPLKSFVLLRHQTVRCVLTLQFWLLTSALFTLHPSEQSIVVPLAHRTVRWFLAEWLWENPRAASSRGALAWAPDRVRCATSCTIYCICSKFCRVPQLTFFVGLCWTLCTWGKWQLGKLVSLYGLWWTSNTKIDYRKCLSSFPFHLVICLSHMMVLTICTNLIHLSRNFINYERYRF
jgi:hypothetical protein